MYTMTILFYCKLARLPLGIAIAKNLCHMNSTTERWSMMTQDSINIQCMTSPVCTKNLLWHI